MVGYGSLGTAAARALGGRQRRAETMRDVGVFVMGLLAGVGLTGFFTDDAHTAVSHVARTPPFALFQASKSDNLFFGDPATDRAKARSDTEEAKAARGESIATHRLAWTDKAAMGNVPVNLKNGMKPTQNLWMVCAEVWAAQVYQCPDAVELDSCSSCGQELTKCYGAPADVAHSLSNATTVPSSAPGDPVTGVSDESAPPAPPPPPPPPPPMNVLDDPLMDDPMNAGGAESVSPPPAPPPGPPAKPNTTTTTTPAPHEAESIEAMVAEESSGCLNHCTDPAHGSCESESNQCLCRPGFFGADCSQQYSCPGGCSGHGRCDGGFCTCNSGFSGDDCGLSTDGGAEAALNMGSTDKGSSSLAAAPMVAATTVKGQQKLIKDIEHKFSEAAKGSAERNQMKAQLKQAMDALPALLAAKVVRMPVAVAAQTPQAQLPPQAVVSMGSTDKAVFSAQIAAVTAAVVTAPVAAVTPPVTAVTPPVAAAVATPAVAATTAGGLPGGVGA